MQATVKSSIFNVGGLLPKQQDRECIASGLLHYTVMNCTVLIEAELNSFYCTKDCTGYWREGITMFYRINCIGKMNLFDI